MGESSGTGDAETLTVKLEDAGGTSWWASLLATLSSQYGNAYKRFVGRVDGERRYVGPTFPVPRTWGDIPPQEAWAPEMNRSLAEVLRHIEDDHWVQTGKGQQPWEFRFTRPR